MKKEPYLVDIKLIYIFMLCSFILARTQLEMGQYDESRSTLAEITGTHIYV